MRALADAHLIVNFYTYVTTQQNLVPRLVYRDHNYDGVRPRVGKVVQAPPVIQISAPSQLSGKAI